MWTTSMIPQAADLPLALDDVVIVVDPPSIADRDDTTCVILCAARVADRLWLLSDATVHVRAPEFWASKACALVRDIPANRITIEHALHSDLVKHAVRQASPETPVRVVRLRHGLYHRLRPVADLYGEGRVSHGAGLERLASEMLSFGGPGRPPNDRLPALAVAAHDLMFSRQSLTPEWRV
jgi:phage terminase large subunit-like protein